jgi:ribosomal protein S18 acetylase RimI-like enzyme
MLVPDNIEIRHCESTDLLTLAAFSTSVFIDAFESTGVDSADMLAHCQQKHSHQYYNTLLDNPQFSIWLAERVLPSKVLVGYALVGPYANPCHLDTSICIELKRLYVTKTYRRTGVGRRLLHKVIEMSRTGLGFTIYVKVYANNHAAISFYVSQGFLHEAKETMRIGNSGYSVCVIKASF